MLRPRVMPCLLLSDTGLVKTIRFDKPNYVGDPLNVVNIFNRLDVDELILLDIDASLTGRSPRFDIIEEVASHCTAPLTYGGGIGDVEEIRRIFEIGAEKIVLGSIAARDPSFITKAADRFGSQAIIVSVDVKKNWLGRYGVYAQHGQRALQAHPVAYAQSVAEHGAGEILLHSIDRDGEMKGYDIDLVRSVADAVNIPVIACGGAGKRQDLAAAVEAGASAAAAGSIFVYQGPERGVLINFPTRAQLRNLLTKPQ